MTRPTLCYWQLSLITVGVLLIHWLCSHCLVHWLGGEAPRVVAQTAAATYIPSHPSSTFNVPAYQADDGWRRTSQGWERISAWQEEIAAAPALPTTYHFSLAQLWPAAWAVGMVALVLIFNGWPVAASLARCHPAGHRVDGSASGGPEAGEIDC